MLRKDFRMSILRVLSLSMLLLVAEQAALAQSSSAVDDEMKSIRSSLLRSSRAKSTTKVEKGEASKLDTEELTPVGAERAGNADGSIPEWTGKIKGLPKGLRYEKTTDVRPDPFPNEKPIYTITAKNMDKYAERLSDGQKQLFKKYPETFSMPVYKTYRDFAIGDFIVDRTRWNANNTKLINGIDGLQNYTGGVPFPLPEDGVEMMWNGRFALFHPTIMGFFDQYAVYSNGKKELLRQSYVSEFPFSYRENIVGVVDDMISTNAALVQVTVEKPDRAKGQMVVVHEALDQVKNERMAWAYMPGSRRVRRAPTVGFDTPDGPGGMITVDDSLGFNGAMYKYRWKYVGKQEMYVPYHNYKFDTPGVALDELLLTGHANPNYMRYELRRVWIVEAVLKSGQRHIYAKRRFYIEEDSWQFVATESYDGRNELWRISILNSVYDFLLENYIPRVQMFHDLQSGSYLSQRMVNWAEPPDLMGQPKGEEYYQPANMRKQSIN